MASRRPSAGHLQGSFHTTIVVLRIASDGQSHGAPVQENINTRRSSVDDGCTEVSDLFAIWMADLNHTSISGDKPVKSVLEGELSC